MFSMRNFIDYNSGVMGFIGTVCDIILLNLFFLISCLPVFTIGAAISGMYYVNMKIVRGECGSIWRTYWKGFRDNFRQATVFWLIFLGIAAILAVDYWILPTMLPDFYAVPRTIVCITFVFACAVALYLFPIVSHFVCTGKQAVKNALLMMVGHFPYTLLLLVINGICLVLSLLFPDFFLRAACIFLVCGFAVVNLISSYIFNRIFKRYETV